MILALAALLLALTRAEIVQRMRAPVVTQADGMVRVYADCPEDMRREFQAGVARFAAETIRNLRRSSGEKSRRYAHPAIIVHLGDVRTNIAAVVTKVATNESDVVSRIYLKAPAYADLGAFRREVVKAFYRTERKRALSDAEAERVYRLTDPHERVREERAKLEDWLAGRLALDDEEALKLMRKIHQPGYASLRDVVTFTSRLDLYVPCFDQRFANGENVISFRAAIPFAKDDLLIRYAALLKARELPVWAGGKGDGLTAAAAGYVRFLLALARDEADESELYAALDAADELLKKELQKHADKRTVRP